MTFLLRYLYGWLWYVVLIRGPGWLFFWTHRHMRAVHDHGLSWLGFYAYTLDEERPLACVLRLLRLWCTLLLLALVALAFLMAPVVPFLVAWWK